MKKNELAQNAIEKGLVYITEINNKKNRNINFLTISSKK